MTSFSPIPLTSKERLDCIEYLASAVCARGFEAPAIFVLEMYRPLTRTFYAVSLVCMPLFVPIFGTKLAKLAIAVLESPKHVQLLIDKIEQQSTASQNSKGVA